MVDSYSHSKPKYWKMTLILFRTMTTFLFALSLEVSTRFHMSSCHEKLRLAQNNTLVSLNSTPVHLISTPVHLISTLVSLISTPVYLNYALVSSI